MKKITNGAHWNHTVYENTSDKSFPHVSHIDFFLSTTRLAVAIGAYTELWINHLLIDDVVLVKFQIWCLVLYWKN